MNRPSAKPPVSVAPVTRIWRRERSRAAADLLLASLLMASRLCRGGTADGAANPDIGAAAADVAGHRRVDVGIIGMGCAVQKRSGRHDLAGLAIAALRHIFRDPGLLHFVQRAVLGKTLDGGDLIALRTGNRQRAGP